MMDYEGGELTAVRCCLRRWSGHHAEPLCAGCGRWSERPGSDDSALEVCIHDDAPTTRHVPYLYLYLYLYRYVCGRFCDDGNLNLDRVQCLFADHKYRRLTEE